MFDGSPLHSGIASFSKSTFSGCQILAITTHSSGRGHNPPTVNPLSTKNPPIFHFLHCSAHPSFLGLESCEMRMYAKERRNARFAGRGAAGFEDIWRQAQMFDPKRREMVGYTPFPLSPTRFAPFAQFIRGHEPAPPVCDLLLRRKLRRPR